MKIRPGRGHKASILQLIALAGATTIGLLVLALPERGLTQSRRIDFGREIRPILSDKCFACHGPDAPSRNLRLRLDSEEGAKADLGRGRRAIVAGDPGRSELVRRITSHDESLRMPPVSATHQLTESEKSLLIEWIREGAPWQQHWAFIPPRRPALPTVGKRAWVRNEIDHFILARLEKEGMDPAPEADRATLLRRVTLDLTGLPPTLAELESFLNDPTADAYEKVVDRLLSSQRYGERMAWRWLDAARYADTNGYQIDGDRSAWRWRDWVIAAFNQNLPYDQFVTEQLAGDLLPAPTLDQRIATAFNRHHRINAEGGIVPEEYAVEYVVDRVDTTSTVFMGLTVGCARCHNHKYDPLTQKEYYQLYAYFNSIPEDGRAFDWGNSAPWISAPTTAEQRQLMRLEEQISTVGDELKRLESEIASRQRRWETGLKSGAEPVGLPDRSLLLHLPLERGAKPLLSRSAQEWHNPQPPKLDEKTKKPLPPTEADEARFVDGQPAYVPTPFGEGMRFDGKIYYNAGRIADFRYKSTSRDFRERFAVSAWIRPESENGGAIFTKMADAADERVNGLPRIGGVGLFHANGRLHFQMVREWNYDGYRSETETTLAAGEWHHVLLQFDGFRQYDDRVRLFVNGVEQKLKVTQPNLYLYWGLPNQPLRIGGGGGKEMRFRGMMDEVRFYTRNLDDDEIAVISCRESLEVLAGRPESTRRPAERTRLRAAFLAAKAPAKIRQLHQQYRDLLVQRQEMIDRFTTIMVMEELPRPRPAHLLRRGAYDAPGERVERGVPSILPPLSAELPNNRLGLAKWLTSSEHPLTSRVAVNRFWQMFFGAGLVRTVEDFGSQGELPSHPELLDWLAVEFHSPAQGRAWDIRSLLRKIVTSATYRQSAILSPTSLQRDPENRLLARGPRTRLSADMIRDQALAAAGLLVEKVGGPSVKPYQPDGLYKDMAFSGLTGYERERGEGLWRRSLYTFWKRTVLSPTMQVFDASAREFCTVRETRTNTPLQSLNLMNDVTYVEASRMIAQRMLLEGGATESDRLAWGFRLVTLRQPDERERGVLTRYLESQRLHFSTHPAEAERLLAAGERRPAREIPSRELAAWSMVASLILNLDETITRQ